MNTPLPITQPDPPAVLLVDDDDFIREAMAAMLAQLGVQEVHQAGNGQQALAVLKCLARPPDFLVCDIYMPDMDGIEFVAALAQLDFRGGVVLISGVNPETLALARDIAQGEGIDLVGAFLKPVRLATLADALGLARLC